MKKDALQCGGTAADATVSFAWWQQGEEESLTWAGETEAGKFTLEQ